MVPSTLKQENRAPWFFHWFGAALLVQYFIEAKHLAKDPNNMLLYAPFAAAMSGHAVVSTSQFIRKLGLRFLATPSVLGLIVLLGFVGRQQLQAVRVYEPYYASFYNIGVKLSKIARPDDLVISFGFNPCAIYYSKLRGWPFPPAEVWNSSVDWDFGEVDIGTLKRVWARGAKWLTIPHINEYIDANDLKSAPAKPLWKYIRDNLQLYEENEDGLIFQFPPYQSQSDVIRQRH
jgi:hypothetical protein